MTTNASRRLTAVALLLAAGMLALLAGCYTRTVRATGSAGRGETIYEPNYKVEEDPFATPEEREMYRR
jgi:hypothetical protein